MTLDHAIKRGRRSVWSIAPLLSCILAAVPLLLLVTLIRRYAVNVPFWDQWELVPLLDKYYQGTLSFEDLWAQHNEHRLLFPRLIMLALALATRWNIGYELAFNVVLAVALFLLVVYQLAHSTRELPGASIWPLLPVLSVLVFGLGQWENWLWGWQIQIFLNVVAVISGIVLLSRPCDWSQLTLAILLGVIATYSFANGILYWVVGGVMLISINGVKSVAVGRKLIVWMTVSVLTLASYLYQYQKPTIHPPLTSLVGEPLRYLEYVLVYLGAPVAGWSRPVALLGGLVGLAMFVAAVALLHRQRGSTANVYIGWALYALLSALMTASGRAGFGVEQALQSRYTTISNLLWVSLVALWYLVLYTRQHSMPRYRLALRLSSALLVAVVSYNALSQWQFWQAHADRLTPTPAAVRAANPDHLLRRVYPNVALVKQRIQLLQSYRLSVFAAQDGQPALTNSSQPPSRLLVIDK